MPLSIELESLLEKNNVTYKIKYCALIKMLNIEFCRFLFAFIIYGYNQRSKQSLRFARLNSAV